MIRRWGAVVALLVTAPLAAQVPDIGAATSARGGVLFETYRFSSGLAFNRVTELVIPISVVQPLGSRLVLDIATAYTSASVRTVAGDIDVSGVVDTDVRAALTLVPGRVIATVVGTLPTGLATVPDTTLPLYGATATDLFGFTVPTLGAGGGVTAGLAGAVPIGRAWALGMGASLHYGAPYVPIEGGGELSPGGEGRARLGIEGPLGTRAYLRATLVYSHSAEDDIAGAPPTVIGDRVLAHLSLDMPLGRGVVSLYGWDMRRFHPSGTGTRVPAGNLLALGARRDRPLSPTLTLGAAIELRHELSGTDSLVVLGWLARPGLDMRLRLGRHAALVTSASYAFGQVKDEGIAVSVHGPRVGLALEWLR